MKVIEQVEGILKFVPAARNSDKVLFITYMQKFGMELSPTQIETFKQMPSLESVRRSRQSIQEQGKYEASEKVNEDRYAKFQQMRNGDYVQPENILEAIDDKNIDVAATYAIPLVVPRYRVLPWNES